MTLDMTKTDEKNDLLSMGLSGPKVQLPGGRQRCNANVKPFLPLKQIKADILLAQTGCRCPHCGH